MTSSRPARWLLAAALLAAGGVTPAHAAPLPRRLTGVGTHAGHLTLSVGLQDLFGAQEKQRLTSGFATRVLIRVVLQEEGASEPLAVAFQRTEIVYDIWDERFRLRVTRGAGPEVHLEARTPEEAIMRAATLWQFPVVDTRRLRPGASYVVAVRGDLNPISEELLSDLRRWLVDPGRNPNRVRAGDTFFGTFVSIFVNPRIEDSERMVRFLSQPFTIKPPATTVRR